MIRLLLAVWITVIVVVLCATGRWWGVVRDGALIDVDTDDPNVQGVRRFHEQLASIGDRVSATTIQTVGSKGYDGFTLAVVN